MNALTRRKAKYNFALCRFLVSPGNGGGKDDGDFMGTLSRCKAVWCDKFDVLHDSSKE